MRLLVVGAGNGQWCYRSQIVQALRVVHAMRGVTTLISASGDTYLRDDLQLWFERENKDQHNIAYAHVTFPAETLLRDPPHLVLYHRSAYDRAVVNTARRLGIPVLDASTMVV